MKTYYGNYLGLVVDDRDPQQRGRTKVFIPHIMPALYEKWNKDGKDIKFNITGTFDSGTQDPNNPNLPAGLTLEIINKLQQMLPWAECAAPIFGSGPAGIFNYQTGAVSAEARNLGNCEFGQYKGGVTGQGGSVVYDAEGDAFEINTSLERPGNTLGTVNEIILHDTGGTGIGFLDARPGGTYNYIVYNGQVYTTVPEGQASTYGTLGRNSTSINIAWVGEFGGTPNATDLNLLRQVTSYAANKYGLSSSQIKTHGAVQANKEGDAEGWAPIVLSQLKTQGKPNENPSAEQALSQAQVSDMLADTTKEEESPGITQEAYEGNSAALNEYNRINETNYTLLDDGVTVVDGGGNPAFSYSADGSGTVVGLAGSDSETLPPLEPLSELPGDEPLPDLSNNEEDLITQGEALTDNPHPTEYPTVFGPNQNYVPSGFFGGAKAGQMVWVFFREGDPLYPVYFAASYGEKEWANINEHSSPNLVKKVKNAGDPRQDPLQGTQNTYMGAGGGWRDIQIVSGQPSGFEKDEFAFEVFGKNGSNLMFTFHATLLNSKYDFRQHTQADAHYITGGNRTDRTTGDHVTICEQDVICTIGNWSKEALEAASNIQKVIDQAMKAAKETYEA